MVCPGGARPRPGDTQHVRNLYAIRPRVRLLYHSDHPGDGVVDDKKN